jgi:hypothetical protein
LILTQPWPASPRDQRRDQVIYYHYRADRGRRTLHGIDEQIGKAEKAVAGKVPDKRNRFIKLVGADKSVNRTLEAKARALAGWKGYADLRIMPTCSLKTVAAHGSPAEEVGIIWLAGTSAITRHRRVGTGRFDEALPVWRVHARRTPARDPTFTCFEPVPPHRLCPPDNAYCGGTGRIMPTSRR